MAEQLIYTSEKSLRDYADKIQDDVKSGIETKIAALKEAKEKDDKSAIETAANELSTELGKIGEIMQQAAAAAEKSKSDTSGEAEQSVRDAEVTDEKKEEDK